MACAWWHSPPGWALGWRCGEAQAYGQQRTAELGIDVPDVPARVQEFQGDSREQARVSSLEPVPAAAVYDINVLVTAAAGGNSPFRSRPSPPPVSGNASADCPGIIVNAAEFALWLSPHIITSIDRVLAQLFKWAQPQIDAYLRRSDGGRAQRRRRCG